MKNLILLLLFIFSFSAIAKEQDYFVILSSFKQPKTVEQGAKVADLFYDVYALGLQPYFIKTDDYPPLTKGLWAMVLGRFDKATAQQRLDQVKLLVNDAYIKKIQPLHYLVESTNFSLINGSLKDKDCFTVDQDLEFEGYERLFCAGREGYQIEKIYSDARVHILIADNEFSSANMMNSQSFPHAMDQIPVSWIYGNDHKLKAVSFALETDNENNTLVASRYIMLLDGANICPIENRFALDDLDGVFDFLERFEFENITCSQ